ncbi:MAG: 2-polyprenyl-3-methyl-6-methoxy-1,4-benzoquinone monooxygenase [Xanthomonadales bacterium]|jgi:ubiquinone biosynthesis monooxygenase Coq7|nr:2-polyprenyl-3-methyl-6-methoxy-1,4-benzoquinone monooxygenase [Xanthomonadales bacterium]
MQERRQFSLLDRCFDQLNQALDVTLGRTPAAQRPYPAEGESRPEYDEAQRRHIAGLMRINHAGEVCAQALYSGQAITARSPEVQVAMNQAAVEELDHLAWCADCLAELNDRPSRLGLFWYGGSFFLGCVAGAIGDRWNLGFLEETERQVEAHLAHHLEDIPQADGRTRAIVEQMKIDEAHHAQMAADAGAAKLPNPVPNLMAITAKGMKALAYRF